MQMLKPLLIAVATLAASQAHAVSAFTYTFGAVPAGAYTAPSFTDGVKTSVHTDTLSSVYLQPKGITGPYLVVSSLGSTPEGKATIATGDVKSYSFVWGSPDTFNFVDIFGLTGPAVTYSGANLASQFGFTANGNNDNTGLFTITAGAGSVIDHLVLRSTGVAFEVAAPVPEPETYALMLAGLGAVGFIARRKRA